MMPVPVSSLASAVVLACLTIVLRRFHRMPRRLAGVTPERARAAAEVLRAFDAAAAAGRKPVDCYRAATAAWRGLYPDHDPGYAASEAVEVVIDARLRIRSPTTAPSKPLRQPRFEEDRD